MKKKWLAVFFISLAAMFGWIFLAVALTGGRDVPDFTQRDRQVMAGFLAAEALSLGALIVSTAMLARQRSRAMPKMEPVTLTQTEKARERTGGRLLWGAFLLAFAGQIGGIFLWKGNDAWVTAGGRRLCGLGYLLGLVVLPLASLGACKLQERKFSRMSAQEASRFLFSHREQAEQTARRKLRKLRLIRLAANGYGLLLLLLGLSLALFSGCFYQPDGAVLQVAAAGLIIGGAFQQLVMPVPKAFLQEMGGLLPEADYPRLYGLARRAAEESGWQGAVRLFIAPLPGACVGMIRQVLCLQLGALTLGTMTEEELYAIFRHEFAHMGAENRQRNREQAYFSFLSEGRNPNALSFFTTLYYRFLDSWYATEHELYSYASTLGIESRADQAMAGNPQAAAASLLKLKYFDLYRWEREAEDAAPDWQPETPPEHLCAGVRERFCRAFPERRKDWQKLTLAEIPARSATHPTTWERIRALGLEQLPSIDLNPKGELAGECARAVEQMDDQMAQGLAESYQQTHRENYLEPLERLTAWEAAGRPLKAEDYADLVEDLQTLNRQSDALELCDRAIRELPAAASCYAYFVRGVHRLHRYDREGLEDLYTAIRGSSNFIDDALEQIGSFCCLMGLREELEEYRQKALALVQRQRDELSQLDSLSRGDKLSQEQLPEGMLEGILAYIREISQDSIEKIFLVRKTITPEFFTSAFVIGFLPETPEQTRREVLHKIFRYLDTSTDWQFSLFQREEVPKGLVERVENSCVFERG